MKTLLLLSLIVLSSCTLSKTTRLSKFGNVEPKEFYGKIHFEPSVGIPILKIKVNGIEANFLFDTGASSNVISPELASKLNLETQTTGFVADSEGKRAILEYVVIDNIAIDNINFLNTSAVVADLNFSESASCFELDGIIGTNLMRMALWKIDHSDKSISFSNDLSKLKNLDGWSTLDYKLTRSGVPKIELELNDKKIRNLTFDTGYDGYISVAKDNLQTLKANSHSIQTAYKTGASSFGLYGLHESDTTFYAKIDKVDLGDLSLNNQIIMFKSDVNLVGSKFLSNYTVIIDWTVNHIYLKETSKDLFDSLETFGFNILLNNGKLIIGSLFGDSEAWDKLKIGDEIIEINGENYQGLSKPSLCDLYRSKTLSFGNLNYLKLKIKRGNEIVSINLEKLTLLK